MRLIKIKNIILSSGYNDALLDIIKQSLINFESKHQSSIINHDKWKENLEKNEYLINPQFKIYEVRNRESSNVLVAKVKWKFLFEGDYIKDKFISVFLGGISKFPKMLDDENLQVEAIKSIKDYLSIKSPPHQILMNDLKKMKEEVELFYYFKNKIIELDYRKSPIFYFSKSKNDKPQSVILNIKWGFEVYNKDKKPLYILKRYTIDKQYIGNIESPDLKSDINFFLVNYINEHYPLSFNFPVN